MSTASDVAVAVSRPMNGPPGPVAPRQAARTWLVFAALTWLAAVVNVAGTCSRGLTQSWPVAAFTAVNVLIYSFGYVALAALVAGVLIWPLARVIRGVVGPAGRAALVATALVGCSALLQIVLYADKFIYAHYGFHLNGFVWNLVCTRGGLQSLGGEASTTASFALICAGLAAVQAALYVLATRWRRLRHAARRWTTWGRMALGAGLLLAGAGSSVLAFGISAVRGYAPILSAANDVPGYFPITFNRLAESLGFEPVRTPSLSLDVADTRLRYPRCELVRRPVSRPPNIVWLVSESLRADMLDAEIMPASYAFAQRAVWCRNHYSAGNGTRMGVFGMFYGLYGPYWFTCLHERRGPVLIDELRRAGYEMQLFTSAAFTYPEFDRTVFVDVPAERLHESNLTPIFARDAEQVDAILRTIDARPADRPFFVYMFFDAPHANYHFPASAVIRRPYLENFNYATMDLLRDIGLIRNRYVNACHYLDSQIARVLDHLAQQKLLDSTVVIITGDHGEEFMERGRWGHNSTFAEPQIRTPMVLWAPGVAPRAVDRPTSHLDLPATLLPLLGVANPPEDYCLGRSLLADAGQPYLVLSDWNRLAFRDGRYKAVIPLQAAAFADQPVTSADDATPLDRGEFYAARRDALAEIMQGLRRFRQ